MNHETIKFYMNNPCKIVRKISDDFSEVKINPVISSQWMRGKEWCSACMIGNIDGANLCHTCDDYQEVIDEINDSNPSIFVIVENRLIMNEPIEARSVKCLVGEINALRIIRDEITNERDNIISEVLERKNQLSIISEAALLETIKTTASVDDRLNVEGEIERLNEKLKTSNVVIAISDGDMTISMSLLRDLVEAKIMIDSLNNGGVDNWEWYPESTPDLNELGALVSDEIIKMKSN